MLNEAADKIFPGGKPVEHDEGETFPFIISRDKGILKVHLGEKHGTHGEIENHDFWSNSETELYRGRAWLDLKIISFWENPTKEELPEILDAINKAFGDKIDWNEWKIEIYHGDESKGWTYDHPEDYEYLPIEKYVGSKNVPRERYLQHILSPINKKEKPSDWKPKKYKYQLPGETEVEARWRVNRYAYQEGLMSFNDFKLFESPDEIESIGLNWKATDARYFGYQKGEFLFGEGVHHNRWAQNYPGRLWLNHKIISFWEYPETLNKLKKIIRDIESRIKENIWNQGWKIDVMENIIPLEDYEGIKDKRSEEELKQQHVLSPMDPRKKKIKIEPKYQDVESKWLATKYMYQEKKVEEPYTGKFKVGEIVRMLKADRGDNFEKVFVIGKIERILFDDRMKNPTHYGVEHKYGPLVRGNFLDPNDKRDYKVQVCYGGQREGSMAKLSNEEFDYFLEHCNPGIKIPFPESLAEYKDYLRPHQKKKYATEIEMLKAIKKYNL